MKTQRKVDTAHQKPVAARRTGYAIAAAVNAVLLYLINGRPGWAAVPFLTADMEQVLPWVNVSLVVGVVVDLVLVLRPVPWLIATGAVVTTAIGLVVLVRMWQVFPFDLGSGWGVVFRVLLVVAIAGSIVALPVQIVSLVRAGADRPPRAG